MDEENRQTIINNEDPMGLEEERKQRNQIRVMTGFSIFFGILAFLAAIYTTMMFSANLEILNKNDLSVLVIILTIPLTFVVGLIEVGVGLPAFLMSLTTAVRYKIKNPLYIIWVVFAGLLIIYPIIMFVALITYGSNHHATSSSELSESVSMILPLL